MASTGMIMKNRPSSWATAVLVLYHMVFHIQAAERRAVVAGRRDVGVEHLGQAVRPWVRDTQSAKGFNDSNGRETKDGERQNKNRQHGHLDVIRFNFLAQVLWSPANHQPCDEDRKDDEYHDAVEASAHSPENNFA